MKRRFLFTVNVMIVFMMVLAGCSNTGSGSGGSPDTPSDSPGETGNSVQPFAGVTLNVISVQDPFFEPLKKALPEFEAETGMKVNLEGVQYNGLRNKIVLDVVGGSGIYDVITTDTMWTGEFVEGNYILPLNQLIEQNKAEIDPEDIPESIWQAFSWQDEVYGVPLSVYAKMLLYRKDLWEDAGHQAKFKEQYGYDLAVPATWDQYRDMAEYFTGDWGDGKQRYGVAFNGKRGASIVHMFFAYANTFGASWFQSYPETPWDFTPTINSSVMKEALEYYVGLRQFAPPEVTDFEWYDTGGAFWNGQVAMMDHWSVYASLASDPSQSQIVGSIGAAVPPGKTEGEQGSQLGGFALSISTKSKQQDAAWEFVKWATSKETLLTMTTENTFDAVNRISVLSDPQIQEKYPWSEAALEAMKVADPEYKPRIPAYSQMEEVLGVALNDALTGAASPGDALDKSQEMILQIVKDAKLLD